ncbi:MAG: excinuclease ABC subunit UvrC [Bacteroidales bacterium]|jgi:excinuclease ABC subunit C|nr:excinuclease ABC subunit UvrC [Bacteroidales bacterium]
MIEELSNINPYIERLLPTLKTLPPSYGVYIYYDINHKVIYVGKAKNLKNRVWSYFRNSSKQSAKTRLLVKKIYDIELVHLKSETEALLLECNLIKKYKPRYNILLKDDKTYPSIKITNEPFPRILKTRTIIKDGGTYLGPYPNAKALNEMLHIIRLAFSYRTCNLNITLEGIKQKKYRSCLNYQLHLCNAPCIGMQTMEDYNKTIQDIKNLIKGDFHSIIKELKEEMMLLAKDLLFERANDIKQRITLLENYNAKSAIVSSNIKNIEVFSFISAENSIFFNMLKIVNGRMVGSFSTEITKKLDETDEEVFTQAIVQMRMKLQWEDRDIIVPQFLELPSDYVKQIVPQVGEKKQLLELSLHNAKYHKLEVAKKAALLDPDKHWRRIVEIMQKELHLKEAPLHIECFDNSNIQGTNPVAACVVFRNGRPSKREYKHYIIKSVVGPDDFASMQEVVFRRYSRLLHEDKALPQLIVVDGGKGQLSATVEILKQLNILDRIAVIGIAKRLEEIFFPNDPIPLCLDKRSETLKVIQQIRDEAHRFGITHHRNKRSKATFKTSLTEIKGIGDKTAQELLLQFSSVKRISLLSLEELTKSIGENKAQIIYNHFHKNI